MPTAELNYLKEDYKLKADFLNAHFSRMWTRFNFFLSVELAVFGVLGYLLFDNDGSNPDVVIFPVLLGLFVSVIWIIVGYQDRQLVRIYREAIVDVTNRISHALKVDEEIDNEFAEWVGKVPVGAKEYYQNKLGIKYIESFSITKLPIWVAGFCILVWIIAVLVKNCI